MAHFETDFVSNPSYCNRDASYRLSNSVQTELESFLRSAALDRVDSAQNDTDDRSPLRKNRSRPSRLRLALALPPSRYTKASFSPKRPPLMHC